MRYQLRYVRVILRSRRNHIRRTARAANQGRRCTLDRHDGPVAKVAAARVGGRWAADLVEVTDDVSCLDDRGRWAVAVPYLGNPVCARFARWGSEQPAAGAWRGPDPQDWTSSMSEAEYRAAVGGTREAIAAGTVYQANICRVLTAPLPSPADADILGLHMLLDAGNPAPYGGFLRLPDQGVHLACASPELFLSVRVDGDDRLVRSGPIKGTGRTAEDLSDKDVAENVMIVDLVRNDLSQVCATGSVYVPDLLRVEEHPGLVHLVSYVTGVLVPGTGWAQVLAAAFPPGSVTGAPKHSALQVIDSWEKAPRDFYCGAFGWVDADTGEAELAVTIRTFWIDGDVLRFGTGAGITWGSDPGDEWRETELKASRLISVAGGTWQASGP